MDEVKNGSKLGLDIGAIAVKAAIIYNDGNQSLYYKVHQ